MSDQKTILIVDDEEDMRITLRSAMESFGFRVLDAENGIQAFEIARGSQPDIVLCDIEMPGKNGFQVLQMFREDHRTSNIPFIFLTGRTDKSDMRKGMNLGADDFLVKPATAKDVVSAVTARIRLREEQEGIIQGKLGELREHITRSVPHELRTPLTGIIGFGQLLQTQGDEMTREEIKEITARIMTSAVNLQTTLEKFWYYSQIVILMRDRKSAANLRLSETEGIHAFLKALSGDKAVSYNRKPDLQVTADQGCVGIAQAHFSKILEEILENAFRFSVPGSKIEVKGTNLSDEGMYEITVVDRGRGMTGKQIGNIGAFVQFERAKYEQQGLGLGLAIAREITSLYHGTFEVKSTPEQGTVVSIRLPLCR
ncbi:MAG: hybrid sensor histidine kinase/response regulator [Ignavibacteriales bacterium]|nr:hybrid sensor histidine kinase/response regulator [Ignavibacteriales bacterium]